MADQSQAMPQVHWLLVLPHGFMLSLHREWSVTVPHLLNFFENTFDNFVLGHVQCAPTTEVVEWNQSRNAGDAALGEKPDTGLPILPIDYG